MTSPGTSGARSSVASTGGWSRGTRTIRTATWTTRLGQDGIRAERVTLGPLVARLHAVYGERFAAAGGRLELAGSPAVPRADPHLLERILANLVDNALTYRRPDVPPLVGIPPEHQERIFALFTRLHREDEYPGTGIGLSIVRKAARLMGTDVTVASVVGEGSTFSLVLPAAG